MWTSLPGYKLQCNLSFRVKALEYFQWRIFRCTSNARGTTWSTKTELENGTSSEEVSLFNQIITCDLAALSAICLMRTSTVDMAAHHQAGANSRDHIERSHQRDGQERIRNYWQFRHSFRSLFDYIRLHSTAIEMYLKIVNIRQPVDHIAQLISNDDSQLVIGWRFFISHSLTKKIISGAVRRMAIAMLIGISYDQYPLACLKSRNMLNKHRSFESHLHRSTFTAV